MLRRIVLPVCAIAVLYCGGTVADALTGWEATAPPLPFRYLGKWTQNGRTTVLLERDHYPYAAHPGQNLDQQYRVDAIETDHIVLTYLPLGARQVLVFENDALPFVPYEPPASPPPEFVALTFSAPNRVAVEQDFLVGVGMQASPGLSASATVELSYDAALLSPAEGEGAGGRTSVRVNASGEEGSENKPAVVRFHVVTFNPILTKIEINARATDASGRALDVRVPDSHALSIVP